MVQGDAGSGQLIHQGQHLVQGFREGAGVQELGADVAVDAGNVQAGQGGGLAIEGQGVFIGHAELVLAQTGGNIGVGMGIHIGIDPQAHRGPLAQAQGHAVEPLQLGRGFHVEAENPGAQGLGHFRLGLADAGEHHLARIRASGQHPAQLPAGDDVKPSAQTGEEGQHSQVGIGLDREAHQAVLARRMGGQGLLEFPVGGRQGGLGIDVTGSAEFIGDAGKGHVFRVQLTRPIGEGSHGGRFRGWRRRPC